jgi:hypothetical protein
VLANISTLGQGHALAATLNIEARAERFQRCVRRSGLHLSARPDPDPAIRNELVFGELQSDR